MYTPTREEKKEIIGKKKSVYRDSNSWLLIDNGSGLPLKLLLYDYYLDNILCFYTYDYAHDFSEQKMAKTRFCRGCHDTKREPPRLLPAESGGGIKARDVQETARREPDLSSCYLEDGSKPGLNRASRSLRRQGQCI